MFIPAAPKARPVSAPSQQFIATQNKKPAFYGRPFVNVSIQLIKLMRCCLALKQAVVVVINAQVCSNGGTALAAGCIPHAQNLIAPL